MPSCHRHHHHDAIVTAIIAIIVTIGVISVFVIGPKMTIFGGAIFGGVFCGLCGSITTTAATGLGQALEGGNCDLQVPRTRVWGTSSARPRDQKLASLSGQHL